MISPQIIDKFLLKIITYGFYALFFVTPLVLTPWNYELFEFNKMVTVYFFTILITCAWLMRMVLQRRILLRRSYLDLPLFLFFIFNFLSFVFSIDRHTSLFGYYSRFNAGLLSIISYLLLYYALVSNLNSKNVLSAFGFQLLAGMLVAVYGILEHFGIDKNLWVQDVQNRVFSTLGQPNWLAGYLVMILPLAMALTIRHPEPAELENEEFCHPERSEGSRPKKGRLSLFGILQSSASGGLLQNDFYKKFSLVSSYLLSILCFLCLLFTKSRSGLLGFIAAYTIFWLLIFLKTQKVFLKKFLLFSFSFLILASATGTPWTPSLNQILTKNTTQRPTTNDQRLTSEIGGTESGNIRRIVWQGAWKIFLSNPFLGTGPETFAYSYYWFRPVEHNLTSEWDFIYNKAHNEYLNYLATTGIFGLGSYLLIIIYFAVWTIKKIHNPDCSLQTVKKHQAPNYKKFIEKLGIGNLFGNWKLEIGNYLIIALFSGYVGLLVSQFFGFSIVITNLFFFLFPALSLLLDDQQQAKKKVQKPFLSSSVHPFFRSSVLQFFSLFLIIFTFFILNFKLTCYWLADYHFATARGLSKTGRFEEARSEFTQAINANRSEPLFQVEAADNLSQLALETKNDASLRQKDIDQAVGLTQRAIQISPYNLNNLKVASRVYYRLSGDNQQYLLESFKILISVSQLAPTDVKTFYNLALLYGQLGDNEKAIETLQNTLRMKEDYQDAWYGLSLFYEETNQKDKAIQALENLLKWYPNDQKSKEKLESLRK